MATSINTPLAYLSYPQLHEGKADDKGVLKFSCALVFPADADLTALRAAIDEAAVKKFGEKGKAMVKNEVLDVSFRKNARKDDYETKCPGGYYLNARTENRPTFVFPYAGTDGKPERVPQEQVRDVFYPGALVRANLSVYAYDRSEKKGVTFGLNGLQLIKNTPRWAGAPDAVDAFDAMAAADLDNLAA